MARPKRLKPRQQLLVTANTGLVGKVLALYFPYLDGDDREEGYAEGLHGLCHAARWFDHKRGFKFSTFACTVVLRWLVNWVEKHERRGFRGLGRNRIAFPLNVGDGVLEGVEGRGEGRGDADLFTLGRLEPAVRRLDARHQVVIREIYQNRASYDEVAVKLGVCKNRVTQMRQEAEVALRGAVDVAA